MRLFTQQKFYASILEVVTKIRLKKYIIGPFIIEIDVIKVSGGGDVKVKVMHLWMKWTASKFPSTH